MNISVVLPTYNERDNIVPLIAAIREKLDQAGVTYQIIVVDDNSPDGTAQAIRAAYEQDPTIQLDVRTQEHGLATAILHGIRRAQGDCVAVMDTDFNHDPILLPQMVELLDYYDLVIGSRFVMGGGMENRRRYLVSFLFNIFVRSATRSQIQDNLSGYFAIRREKLLALDLDRIFRGYGEYFIRLLYVARQYNYRMIEVPAFYILRRHGQSKSHFFHMLCNYTRCVLELHVSRWL